MLWVSAYTIYFSRFSFSPFVGIAGSVTAVCNLENPSLAPLLKQLPEVLVHSRQGSTVRGYHGAYSAWSRWAGTYKASCMPADPITFALYLLSRIQQGHSYAVCKNIFYGIKHTHKIHLQPDPTENTLAQYLLEAAKRLDTRQKNQKEPISIQILEKLYNSSMEPTHTLTSARIMCFCILGFAGFLRFDEISVLYRSDFTFHDTYMTIFIEQSKTDTYREGRTICIAKGESKLCPVAITTSYFSTANMLDPSSDSSDVFIFRAISHTKKGERLRPKNQPISYTRVRELLLAALKAVGIESHRFGTHSLRAGGATEAANAGVPDRLFKRHGRWVSETAKDGYIKDDMSRLLTVTQSLGL